MRCAKVLALMIPLFILGAASALAQPALDINVAVNVAPPPIPEYEQPPLPGDGYLWTPGYWAWDGMDYYWVPGTWVEPPVSGLLWTPGYWGWDDNGSYVWNAGYWAPEVGFYGGIDYGFGYGGAGYQGGYWHGGAFFYNRSVANFGDVRIVNVYSAPAPHWGSSHVSFNGGRGGLRARPSDHDRVAMNERHVGLTREQREHWQHAQGMRELHASQNGGRPQILTTSRASDFAHPGPGLHNHATPRATGETPRATGGAPQFRSGQGAQIEHQEPQPGQPGRGSASMRAAPGRPDDGAGQHLQSREQLQPHDQGQPRQQFQPHEQGQPHQFQSHEQDQPRPQLQPHEQARPPQMSHDHEPSRVQGGRGQPQGEHEAAHPQAHPQAQPQGAQAKERRKSEDRPDH